MKQKIQKIIANYCVWYFLSVIVSCAIVFVLVALWGDSMQDWMYLRHQDMIPAPMVAISVLFITIWYLRFVVELVLRRVFDRKRQQQTN